MKEKVKIGYIGCGRRGRRVLKETLRHMSDVEIVAICDMVDENIDKICGDLKEVGRPEPIITKDYFDIINNPEIDAVFVMTGWQNRAEIATNSLYAGKYTGIEVGCAFDLKELDILAEAYEKTKTPLMMLENCCYGRREMMVLNLVDQGLLGEIVHCAGGYHHYLNDMELFYQEEEKKFDFPFGMKPDGTTDHYRIKSYISRNCEQYPTHELGPISKVLKINRGNKMLTLSSFASKSRGLKSYAAKKFGKDSYYANIDYKQGDIINTIITCAGGETIHLCLDTTLPRAYYSRNFTVRGTEGMYTEERKVLYFSDMKEGAENNEEEMYEKYDHPLHREYENISDDVKKGHGGMDYLVCRAFIESVKAGVNTPIDAYDTLLWMSIAPLSELSIAMGGAPVSVPDYTRGKWLDREPVVEGKYCLDKVCEDESVSIIV